MHSPSSKSSNHAGGPSYTQEHCNFLLSYLDCFELEAFQLGHAGPMLSILRNYNPFLSSACMFYAYKLAASLNVKVTVVALLLISCKNPKKTWQWLKVLWHIKQRFKRCTALQTQWFATWTRLPFPMHHITSTSLLKEGLSWLKLSGYCLR